MRYKTLSRNVSLECAAIRLPDRCNGILVTARKTEA
jgi:hypothetical protein